MALSDCEDFDFGRYVERIRSLVASGTPSQLDLANVFGLLRQLVLIDRSKDKKCSPVQETLRERLPPRWRYRWTAMYGNDLERLEAAIVSGPLEAAHVKVDILINDLGD